MVKADFNIEKGTIWLGVFTLLLILWAYGNIEIWMKDAPRAIADTIFIVFFFKFIADLIGVKFK